MNREINVEHLTVEYLEVVDSAGNNKIIIDGGGDSGIGTMEFLGENHVKIVAGQKEAKIELRSSEAAIMLHVSDESATIVLESGKQTIKLSERGVETFSKGESGR